MVSSLRRAIALLLVVLALGLTSCGGDRSVPTVLLDGTESAPSTNPLIGAMSEVSPPERIQQLKPYLDVYTPQVRILSPRENETLEATSVAVKLQVRDFTLYKDQNLGLGPHLHLFLDDQPYQAIYSIEEPVVFADLAPGTHTLRVFAARPWHESFKNEGAYDQVTFNVFAQSPTNSPDDSQALLTYSRPQGSYGAEPIMLDFYLTNAPLHLVAESDEAIADWRIRCTINGESFVFDRWQPIYLKGFQPGKNWVKLEAIDENGSLIDNAFNPGLRLIEYTPGGEDGLAKLIRGEIPLSQAKVLVDPTYVPPAPAVAPEPTPAAPPAAVPADTAPPEAPVAAPPAQIEAAPVEPVSPVAVSPVAPETAPEKAPAAPAEREAKPTDFPETSPAPETEASEPPAPEAIAPPPLAPTPEPAADEPQEPTVQAPAALEEPTPSEPTPDAELPLLENTPDTMKPPKQGGWRSRFSRNQQPEQAPPPAEPQERPPLDQPASSPATSPTPAPAAPPTPAGDRDAEVSEPLEAAPTASPEAAETIQPPAPPAENAAPNIPKAETDSAEDSDEGSGPAAPDEAAPEAAEPARKSPESEFNVI